MATNAVAPAPNEHGVVTLDGLRYMEVPQTFGETVEITSQFQVFTNQRLTLPGVANFLLKGLARDVTGPRHGLIPPPPFGSAQEAFRFKLSNAEGATWFFSSGLGIFDDRVFDTLCFGSGQFPFPLIPPIPVHASGSLVYEVEDMGFRASVNYPYTIHLAFIGAYLLPVQ